MHLFRRRRPTAAERKRLSVQQQIPVANVVDGLVLRKDGAYLQLLEVSTVNLDLLTPGERRQVLRAYAQFANSLSYPVQICSMAQALDLTEYLKRLQAMAQAAPEPRRRHLTHHVEFLDGLTAERSLQLRRFLLVIPYDLPGRPPTLDQVRKELGQRSTLVAAGLARCGINTRVLDSTEIAALLHTVYNPDLTLAQRVESPFVPAAVWPAAEKGGETHAEADAAAAAAD